MRKTISLPLRFRGVREHTESPDWWAYFGSFGDDIVGEEDIDEA